MTKKEYADGINKIEADAKKAKQDLARQYAEANNPYKVGDVIKDHHRRIRIDSMRAAMPSLSNYPCMVFVGPLLTKTGREFKNGDRGLIWQSNIKEGKA